MINVDNVTKQFGDFYALKDCTIKIGSGSAYGLLGSNGAGKSTLLRILAGIYRQDSGEVTIDESAVYDNVAVKQRIFYVSDDVEQYANMTPDDMKKCMRYSIRLFQQKSLKSL